MRNRREVYLDHSASTPQDPRVLEAMLPWLREGYGNSSSAHRRGQRAARAIEEARMTVARALNCHPGEIIFNSGGTEGDNHAIRGGALAMRADGRGTHLLSQPTEHSAVSNTLRDLCETHGFTQTLLPVDEYGRVAPADFRAVIREDTVLASVMLANNEVGTIQPVAQLARIARAAGVLFHTDAVQAAGQLRLDVRALGIDMLNISAHKFYGPTGVGALYVREGLALHPTQTGGGHEDGRRAGTHSTAQILGLARALELADAECDKRAAHLRTMREYLVTGILERIPGARLTGHPQERLPAHASFVIEGVESGALLMHLDVRGVAGSGGSACHAGDPMPSPVLLAMGYNESLATAGLRLSVGRGTCAEDIDYALDMLVEAVGRLRVLAAV